MQPENFDAQAFLVRIWVEEPEAEGADAVWRGHVTKLPDGDRRYVDSIEGICGVIADLLQMEGGER